MVDAHAHLDKYGAGLPRALHQIREMQVHTLAVSMDVESFRATQRIANEEPLVLASFGVHPWNASAFASDLDALEAPLAEAALIGEVGLDHRFVRDERRYPAQRVVFEYFLDAAARSGRLLNLHTAGAERAVLECVRGRALDALIIHWYSGPEELVKDFLDLGAYFTVGVEILRSPGIRALARSLPEDRLLTETDNPGGWAWLAGEAGFPELLCQVEEVLAELRGSSRAELSARVEANFRRVLHAGGVEVD
jgi:TatD DNase family protein